MQEQLDQQIDLIRSLHNGCVIAQDNPSYVEEVLLPWIPFTEQDPGYVNYIRKYDTVAIGLGNGQWDNDTLEDNTFCVHAPEIIVEDASWQETRFLELATGTYLQAVEGDPLEVWYSWGLDVDQPRGVLQRISIDEKVVQEPFPRFNNFLSLLEAAAALRGVLIRLSDHGEPF